MINDRELLLAVKERRREERIFYSAEFAGSAWDNVRDFYGIYNYEELYDSLGLMRVHTVKPVRRPDAPVFDYSQFFKDIKIPKGVIINDDGVLHLPDEKLHFTHLISPLRNIYDFDEIKKFPYYKKKEYYDFSDMKSQIEEIHKKDKIAQCWIGRLFETSWPLRGYENMLVDMLIEPEIAEYFLDNELEWNLEYTRQAAIAGADMICYGDDVGSQKALTFSAELWRKMYKPRWARIFAEAKKYNKNAAIWYHSCGCITEIIPDLIEVGLDILNPIQPECMDIYNIQKKYGDKLSFDGGLGTQKLVPFGLPSDIEKEVTRLVDVFGKNGGFILTPSHVIEPEVPMQNVKAFIDTARKVCKR